MKKADHDRRRAGRLNPKHPDYTAPNDAFATADRLMESLGIDPLYRRTVYEELFDLAKRVGEEAYDAGYVTGAKRQFENPDRDIGEAINRTARRNGQKEH